MVLAVVHEHGTFVEDWHLGEARRRVHDRVDKGGHHRYAEERDHGVVLALVAWLCLLSGAAKHGCGREVAQVNN